MSHKRKHRSTNEYLKYLKGELSREERHSFERDLEADLFEMEAMEGMEKNPVAEVEEDFLSLHATLQKRLKRRRRRTLYSIAASIASLLIVGTVFLNIYNINPKSAQESVPKDETFLHEEPAAQGAAPVQEEKSVDQIITEMEYDMEQELTAEEMDTAQQEGLAREEAPDRDETVVHEERALRAVEMVSEDAEAPAEFPAQAPVEAPVLEETPNQQKELAREEAPVPAQLADEVVVMEAQSKRSQKKGRAKEAAPHSYSIEEVGGIVVSSEDMGPLPGASIMVKGSDSGMVADMEGRFSLVTEQQAQTTVIASYVGMETEEYQLAGGTENRVVMQPDMATLNEVVVIGYDADKETYATGAVQTIKLDKEESGYSGAEPEGGLEAYKMYIEEQIRFPAGYTNSKREVVVMKFNVALDGSISHILTLRSPGEPFTEEAIRLLKEGPSWNAAQNESGTTQDVVRMRIVFKR